MISQQTRTTNSGTRMGLLKKLRIERLLQRGVRPLLNEFKAALVALKLGEHTFPVNDFGDVKFRCRSVREIILTSDFANEKEALGTFLFLLEPEDVVWDVGAAFGLFAIHSGAIARKVIAFEPDPESRKRLEGNIEANDQSNRTSVMPLALSDSAGEIELFTSGLTGKSPSLEAQDGGHSGKVTVETQTIDAVIAAGTTAPSVIKIDVEGAEAKVLKGATELLNGPNRPRLIFVEVHPEFLPAFGDSAELVEELLRSAGYTLIATSRRADQYHVVATLADQS